VGKIESRDRGGWRHGKATGQLDAGIFRGVEHIEQDRLQTVVGAGRIAGGGADTLIFFPDQVLVVQFLVRGIAPQVPPHMRVHALGKGFRQPVGQRFQQDAVIVVLVHLEALDMFLDAMAGGNGKAADPVIFTIDEIGETMVRLAATLDHLLAEHRQGKFFILRRDQNIIAFAPGAPEAGHALCGQPFFLDDRVEHRLGIAEQVAGAFADDLVGQDRGIIAGQLPGTEKRRPVDIVAQVGQIPVVINVQSRFCRGRRLERHVNFGGIGARLFQRGKLFPGLARSRDAHQFIFFAGSGDKADGLGVTDQLRGHADRAARIQHMDGRTAIGRFNPQGRMGFRGGRAADQQRHLHLRPLHLFGNGDHFIQRRRNQPGQADDIRLIFVGGLQYVRPGDHHPEIDDLEPVALQHDADDILADIVHIALDRGHDDLALTLRLLVLFRLDIGEEMGDRLLHHAGGFHHLRQEHLARPEQVADDIHAVHQWPLDHLDRPAAAILDRDAHFLGIVDDMRVNALDQRMFQPLMHFIAAPFRCRLFRHLVGAAEFFRQSDQPVGSIVAAVEDHILAQLAQFGVDIVIDVELAGVDNRHVHAGRDRMIEKDAVHRLAHRLVAAKAERQVRQAAGNMDMRAALADLARGLDKVEPVAAVLVDAGGNGEHIGVEDDVFRREADSGQQLVGALANLDLALLGIRLASFIKGHHHYGSAIGHALPRMVEKLLLAFLHRNRIDDRLAGHAFQTRLDHRPFRAVYHHGDPSDIGFGGDQL